MKEMRLQYPVPMMCRIYDVSASGYYAYVSKTAFEAGAGRYEVGS